MNNRQCKYTGNKQVLPILFFLGKTLDMVYTNLTAFPYF